MNRPSRAVEVMAECLKGVVGPRSEAYRDLMRAIEVGGELEWALAEASFDALPLETRQTIAERARAAVHRHRE